jgi:hypothetical protein
MAGLVQARPGHPRPSTARSSVFARSALRHRRGCDTIVRPASKDASERRHLTVTFCDLVGSTAMSAWLDPQDKRGIIGPFVP